MTARWDDDPSMQFAHITDRAWDDLTPQRPFWCCAAVVITALVLIDSGLALLVTLGLTV